MSKDYDKLKEIVDEIDVLIDKQVRSSTPEFQAWHSKTKHFLRKKYGKNSDELSDFINRSFTLRAWSTGTSDYEWVRACVDGLKTAKAVLENSLKEILEDELSTECTNTAPIPIDYSKVFIVHGHNGELKEKVARLIEQQGITAIILSEQANKGRTIIEKMEDYGDVQSAVCLFTADDEGNEKTSGDSEPRARQNVVFETGYFMGRLGRKKLIIIAENEVEMPSDLGGVVYTNTANWQLELLNELDTIGYIIDLNKLKKK